MRSTIPFKHNFQSGSQSVQKLRNSPDIRIITDFRKTSNMHNFVVLRPNSLENSNLYFVQPDFTVTVLKFTEITKQSQSSYKFQILSKTLNMHNFVILNPNLDFQESILVKISQALILFNYISPNQPQTFQKLQNRPKLSK